MCRCLHALAEWERLSEACRYEWRRLEPHVHPQMAHLGANAAWHMGQWDEMATYVSAIESEEGPELSTGSFLSAVLNVRHGNYAAAKGLLLAYHFFESFLLPTKITFTPCRLISQVLHTRVPRICRGVSGEISGFTALSKF